MYELQRAFITLCAPAVALIVICGMYNNYASVMLARSYNETVVDSENVEECMSDNGGYDQIVPKGTPRGIPAAVFDRNKDGDICVLYNANSASPRDIPVQLTDDVDIAIKPDSKYRSYYVYSSSDKRACVLFLAEGISRDEADVYISSGFRIEGAEEHHSHT